MGFSRTLYLFLFLLSNALSYKFPQLSNHQQITHSLVLGESLRESTSSSKPQLDSKQRKHKLTRFRKLLVTSSFFLMNLLPQRARAYTDIGGSSQLETHQMDVRNEDIYLNEGNQKFTQSTSSSKSSLIGTSFVRDAVRRVGPSVVRVDCERELPPLFQMFNDQYKEGDTVKVGGSGIIITADGYILTNSHVVENAKKLTVSLSNGHVYKCKVISYDELSDLALLKADIGSELLQPAPLGDSSELNSGDWVVAVGNPVGLDWTVTLGIVSNPKRSASEVGAMHMKGFFIQTDAALNSGNSGGPLVNEVGQVIGINTMVRSNTESIGFAIPINHAKRIYNILRQGKKVSHAYFGLEVMTISPDVARINNDDPNAQRLPEVHGALVVRVVPGSPAAQYGLRKHDIIVNVNGIDIPTAEDADTNLDLCAPNQLAKLRVARGESNDQFEIQVAPQDLQVLLEEKKKRLQSMIVLKQPNKD